MKLSKKMRRDTHPGSHVSLVTLWREQPLALTYEFLCISLGNRLVMLQLEQYYPCYALMAPINCTFIMLECVVG